MNNDLISRDVLNDILELYERHHPRLATNVYEFGVALRELIDNAPTVPLPDFKEGYKQAILDGKTNFSRPQGEWIMEENNKDYPDGKGTCSHCGYEMDVKRWEWLPAVRWYLKPKFCPECGADMTGENTDS